MPMPTSQSRSRGIEPSLSNSPYLTSPIRPLPSSSKHRPKKSPNYLESKDSVAPLRDVTLGSQRAISTGRYNSRTRARLLHSDDCCSLTDTTICTARTSRTSPYLSGAASVAALGSTGVRGQRPKPPKLLLMPNELDDMILEFKQKQHEEGKLFATDTNSVEVEEKSSKDETNGKQEKETADSDEKKVEDSEEEYAFSDSESTVDVSDCKDIDDAQVEQVRRSRSKVDP